MWLKRDDLSGSELSGNKVRKLEFLLAEALAEGADCVVTCGGLQSNHCRAVAVAARSLGLESHLVLRLEDPSILDARAACANVGLSGNLLLKRMVGASIHLATRKEYRKHGSHGLMEHIRSRLASAGRKPYVIPLGGSNPLGTWGYLSAFEELQAQLVAEGLVGRGEGAAGFFSDIVISTGSGGSLAGLALANRLALNGAGAKIWGFGACDSPAWFHGFINKSILAEMLPPSGEASELRSEDLVEIRDAKNLGYAASAAEELQTIRDVALRTGVLFDPVYSGKAMHAFSKLLRASPELFGERVLFWHTGGLFGLWDKLEQLEALIDAEPRSSDGPDVAPVF